MYNKETFNEICEIHEKNARLASEVYDLLQDTELANSARIMREKSLKIRSNKDEK